VLAENLPAVAAELDMVAVVSIARGRLRVGCCRCVMSRPEPLTANVAQVRVHRMRGDVKARGDLTVGRPADDQPDDRELRG
jgi:hypothetical protein